MNSPIEISKFLKNGNLSRSQPLPEETHTLEYKLWQYPFSAEDLNRLYTLYCAWLNTTGGRLFIGVEEHKKSKEGIVVGYSLTPEEIEALKDLLSFKKAKILPEPPAENMRLTFIPTENKQYVISVEIKPGDKKSLYGRDTGHLSYIKTCIWNETTQECEEVKIKLDHVQRLAEDENNPLGFAFDESFEPKETPEAAKGAFEEKKEGELKEKSRKIAETHQKNRDDKLARTLGEYIQRFSDGQLIQLLDGIERVEKDKPYGSLDVWRGLDSIKELQDACIKKLESLVSEKRNENRERPSQTCGQQSKFAFGSGRKMFSNSNKKKDN